MTATLPTQRARPLEAIALFAPTIFISAWLLFLVQPLFAKMALPLLGGTPNVWNAALVFFQAMLLLGYLYAHLLSRFAPPRLQLGLHTLVLALAFVVLPLGIGAAWQNPPAEAPTGWLFALFGACVGLPFFAVSANAPLLQRWFARTGHPQAHDPYFLYGASNLGSVLALLAYPALIEPLLPLRGQSWLWTGGYALLVVMIVGCGLISIGGPADATRTRVEMADDGAVVWRKRLHWIALAFVPSGLLLSVTTFITTDLVAIPLLWVVPLSLFLLTFVFVFARKPPIKHRWMLIAQSPLLIAGASVTFLFATKGGFWSMGIVLLAFFVTAMVCHGELARQRPAARHLTEFYLWMSLGGIMGGAFTALAAPLLFDSVLEYPLLLVLAALLRPAATRQKKHDKTTNTFVRLRLLDVGLPAICVLGALALDPKMPNVGNLEGTAIMAVLALCIFTLVTGISRPLRLALGLAALTVLGNEAVTWFHQENQLLAARSFFGVYKVRRTSDNRFTLLIHGTTIHGVQHTEPEGRLEPRTYYHREAGIGRIFTAAQRRGLPLGRVGAVGLGAGEIACYRRPGEQWTFFEIDPLVIRIARDRRLFRYLSDCAPKARTVAGDGRLMLGREPGRAFDMLILDAFSSDAIPVHLLTREAFAVYLSKLQANGILMVHLSNRYLDLTPVVAALAEDARLSGSVLTYVVKTGLKGSGYKASSIWVALARNPETLNRYLDRGPAEGPQWQDLVKWRGKRLWTDDFSNVLGTLR